MGYRILTDDRKDFVNKVKEMTGEKPVYTGVPRMAYLFRGIALEKDGSLTVEDGADRAFLGRLIDEGLAEGEGTEDEHEAAPEDEELPSTEERQPEETVNFDGNHTGHDGCTPHLLKPNISFPADRHRAESLCNLIFTIYSRGKLISKATGGDFYASQDLVTKLETEEFKSPEDVAKAAAEAGPDGLRGLEIGNGKVTFTGFPPIDDSESIRAWTALASAINRTAIKQKRVRAKEVDDSNEKFAFRTWLTRLGMNGEELKTERSILYKNLSGHTAFRTDADREKWEARQTEKRRELRERKAAEAERNGSSDETQGTE